MLDAFKLIAILIASILWCAWLVLVLRERDVHPLRDTFDRFGRLGWMKKVGVLFLVVQMTMFGGAKHGGTNDVGGVTGTNEVEIVGGGGQSNLTSCAFGLEVGEAASSPLQQRMFSPLKSGETPLPRTDVLSDFTRGYRLESVLTNEDYSYALPADGAVRGTWRLTGAYEDVGKVSFDSHPSSPIPHPFLFPLGNNLCTSLWAYTWGKVRPQLKNATNEIVAVGAPMSAIPFVSRFWTAATTNDTYLLTWENFTFGRVPVSTNTSSLIPHPSSLVSAQLELSRNGDFITRSNNVGSVYRRVIEPNPIGPVNPPDPEDPTMPIRPYDPVQDLSVINETNAYCWVDIVVNNADAWVRFEGDGPSNLADPSFAAKAGETNRVVILIGKTYKVTCDMDFSVIAKSDPAIDERWEDDHTLWLNWPVTIEAWEGNGKSFMMHVVPNCLAGIFFWTNSCSSVMGSGVRFSYGCDEYCHCTGCSASGFYRYEGYCIGCNGGWCGCSYVPGEWSGQEGEGEESKEVVVSFADDVVIFEDRYETSPGVWVERRSTTTVLTCSISGGLYGGTYSFSLDGESKLQKLGGGTMPSGGSVNAGETLRCRIEYAGQAESGGTNDITATLTFTENMTGRQISDDDSLTAIRVKIQPQVLAPENNSRDRHVFGVRELVNCLQYPQTPRLSWSVAGNGSMSNGVLTCPLDGALNPLVSDYNGVVYQPQITVVEPAGVEARDVEEMVYSVASNHAGGVGMIMSLYVLPMNVSFSNIAIEEIPNMTGVHSGYFGNPQLEQLWYHTRPRGAGRWWKVEEGNCFADDEPRIEGELYRVTDDGIFTDDPRYGWSYGELNWSCPFGWNEYNTNGETTEHGRFATGELQEMVIFSTGKTGVRKLRNTVTRDIDGKVYLNGERKR